MSHTISAKPVSVNSMVFSLFVIGITPFFTADQLSKNRVAATTTRISQRGRDKGPRRNAPALTRQIAFYQIHDRSHSVISAPPAFPRATCGHRGYSGLNNSAIVTPRAFANFTRFSSDGFRNARSIPARYVRCMSAASASFSCDHFRSRRRSRRRSARARFVLTAETKRPSWNFVDYESVEYK